MIKTNYVHIVGEPVLEGKISVSSGYKVDKIQTRLNRLVDEIGYSLYELALELKKTKNSGLYRDIMQASANLADFCKKLERNHKYNFNEEIILWIEGKEEWNDAAWEYLTQQDNNSNLAFEES